MSGSMFAFRPDAREFTPSGSGVSPTVPSELFDDATAAAAVKGISLGVTNTSTLQPINAPTTSNTLPKTVYLGSELSAASTSASSNVSKSNCSTKLNPDAPPFVPKPTSNAATCSTIGRSSTVALPSAYAKPVRSSIVRGASTDIGSKSNIAYIDQNQGGLDTSNFSLEPRAVNPVFLDKQRGTDIYDPSSGISNSFGTAEVKSGYFEPYSGTHRVLDVMGSGGYHVPYHHDFRGGIEVQNVGLEDVQQNVKKSGASSVGAGPSRCLENVPQPKASYGSSVPLYAPNSGTANLKSIPTMYRSGLNYQMGAPGGGSKETVNAGPPVIVSELPASGYTPGAVVQDEGLRAGGAGINDVAQHKHQPQHQRNLHHNGPSTHGRQNRRSPNRCYEQQPRGGGDPAAATGKRYHSGAPSVLEEACKEDDRGVVNNLNRVNQQQMASSATPPQRQYVEGENTTQNGGLKAGTPRGSGNVHHNNHYHHHTQYGGDSRSSMKDLQQQNHPATKRVSGTYGSRRNMTAHINNSRIANNNMIGSSNTVHQGRGFRQSRAEGAISSSYHQYPRRNQQHPSQSGGGSSSWQQQRVQSNYVDYQHTSKLQGGGPPEFMTTSIHGENGGNGAPVMQNEQGSRRASEQRRGKDGGGAFRQARNRGYQGSGDSKQFESQGSQRVPVSSNQQQKQVPTTKQHLGTYSGDDLMLSNAAPRPSAGVPARSSSYVTSSAPTWADRVKKPTTSTVPKDISSNEKPVVGASPPITNSQIGQAPSEIAAQSLNAKNESAEAVGVPTTLVPTSQLLPESKNVTVERSKDSELSYSKSAAANETILKQVEPKNVTTTTAPDTVESSHVSSSAASNVAPPFLSNAQSQAADAATKTAIAERRIGDVNTQDTTTKGSAGVPTRASYAEIAKKGKGSAISQEAEGHLVLPTANRGQQQQQAVRVQDDSVRDTKKSVHSSAAATGSPSTRRRIENAPIRQSAAATAATSNHTAGVTNIGYSNVVFDGESAQSFETSQKASSQAGAAQPVMLLSNKNGNQRPPPKVTFGFIEDTASLGSSHSGVVLPQSLQHPSAPSSAAPASAQMHPVLCQPMLTTLQQIVPQSSAVPVSIPLANEASLLNIPSFGVQGGGNSFSAEGAVVRVGSVDNSVVHRKMVHTRPSGQQHHQFVDVVSPLGGDISSSSVSSDVVISASAGGGGTENGRLSAVSVSEGNRAAAGHSLPSMVNFHSSHMPKVGAAETALGATISSQQQQQQQQQPWGLDLGSGHGMTPMISDQITGAGLGLDLKHQKETTGVATVGSEEVTSNLHFKEGAVGSSQKVSSNNITGHVKEGYIKNNYNNSLGNNTFSMTERVVLSAPEMEESHYTASKKQAEAGGRKAVNEASQQHSVTSVSASMPPMVERNNFIRENNQKHSEAQGINYGIVIKNQQQNMIGTGTLVSNASLLTHDALKLPEKKGVVNSAVHNEMEEKGRANFVKPGVQRPEENVILLPNGGGDDDMIQNKTERSLKESEKIRQHVSTPTIMKGEEDSPHVVASGKDEVRVSSIRENSCFYSVDSKKPFGGVTEENMRRNKQVEELNSDNSQIKIVDKSTVETPVINNNVDKMLPSHIDMNIAKHRVNHAVNDYSSAGMTTKDSFLTSSGRVHPAFGSNKQVESSTGLVPGKYSLRILLKCRQLLIREMTSAAAAAAATGGMIPSKDNLRPQQQQMEKKKQQSVPKEIFTDKEKEGIFKRKYSIRVLLIIRQQRFFCLSANAAAAFNKQKQSKYMMQNGDLKATNENIMNSTVKQSNLFSTLMLGTIPTSLQYQDLGCNVASQGITRNSQVTRSSDFLFSGGTSHMSTQHQGVNVSSKNRMSYNKPPQSYGIANAFDSYLSSSVGLDESSSQTWRNVQQQQQRFDDAPLIIPEENMEPEKPVPLGEHFETIKRKIRSLLNKLTIEKFDRLYGMLLNMGLKFEEDITGLMELICSKARTQHHFVPMYVRLCVRLNEDFSKLNIVKGRASDYANEEEVKNAPLARLPGEGESKDTETTTEDKETKSETAVAGAKPQERSSLFRQLLIDACEMTFHSILEPTVVPDNLNPADKLEYLYVEKQRKRGLVLFVAELCNEKMIACNVVLRCMFTLFESKTEPSLELLHELMLTVGGRVWLSTRHNASINALVSSIQRFVEDKSNNLSVRIRCLLDEILVASRNDWKRTSLVEKTVPMALDEISKSTSNVKDRQGGFNNSSMYPRKSQYQDNNMSGYKNYSNPGGNIGSQHQQSGKLSGGYYENKGYGGGGNDDFHQSSSRRNQKSGMQQQRSVGHDGAGNDHFLRKSGIEDSQPGATKQNFGNSFQGASQLTFMGPLSEPPPFRNNTGENSVFPKKPVSQQRQAGVGATKNIVRTPPPPPEDNVAQVKKEQQPTWPVNSFNLENCERILSNITTKLHNKTLVEVGLDEVNEALSGYSGVTNDNLSSLISFCLWRLVEAKVVHQQFVADWILGWLDRGFVTAPVFEAGCKDFLENRFKSAKYDAPNIASTLQKQFVDNAKGRQKLKLSQEFLNYFEAELVRLDKATM